MSWRLLTVVCVLPACARASSAEVQPSPVVRATASAEVAPPIAPPPEPPVTVAVAVAPPPVTVRTIGMHIGGGPNDDITKAPFMTSIDGSSAALAACWAALPNHATVDFGVDALVPGSGGRAKIDRPRSTVSDEAFIACARDVFAAIEFLKPRSGVTTKVSASVRMASRAK